MKTQKIKSFRIFFLLLLAMVLSSPAFASPIVDGLYSPTDLYDTHYAMTFNVKAKNDVTFEGTSYKKDDNIPVGGGGLHMYNDTANSQLFLALVLPRTLVDNSYGANSIGWGNDAVSGKNHNFKDLEGSDKANFEFLNADGGTKLSFEFEYWKYTSPPADVDLWATSLRHNIDKYSSYKKDSPLADKNYNIQDTNAPEWEFSVIYEMAIDTTIFGPSGFGSVIIPELHASPNKIGHNKTTPNPVPIPGAVWLFGSGLIGLFGYRKRAKK